MTIRFVAAQRSALAVVALLLLAAPVADAQPPGATRSCGDLTVSYRAHHVHAEGQAHKILATRVSCHRARVVAKACILDRLKGWHVFRQPLTAEMTDTGRTILQRAQAKVSFQVIGGGGCAT